jgi:hypothetical protein
MAEELAGLVFSLILRLIGYLLHQFIRILYYLILGIWEFTCWSCREAMRASRKPVTHEPMKEPPTEDIRGNAQAESFFSTYNGLHRPPPDRDRFTG